MKLQDIFRFGKHKGKTLKKVICIDVSYVEWCIGNVDRFELDTRAERYYRKVKEK